MFNSFLTFGYEKSHLCSRTDGSKTKKPYYLKSITKNLLTTLNPTDSF